MLVEGETGSGKELVANLLHRTGPRRGKPFVAVNCAALPEALAETELFGHESGAAARGQFERIGRIESSSGGTLFLDEIDSMAGSVQAKMLRVLEEREVLRIGGDRPRAVRLRVVAAAKADLEAAVRAGAFREDLFYRLNVVRLRIPPLRERRSDIPQLFAYFVNRRSIIGSLLPTEGCGAPPARGSRLARQRPRRQLRLQRSARLPQQGVPAARGE